MRREDNLARKQRGFTLIEALITIVIISLGLLGLLALQTFAISATQSSQYRTIASIGVSDIAARIAANPVGARKGAYNAIDSPAPQSSNCLNNRCGPAALATYDAAQWQRALANALPGGRGFVDCSKQTNPNQSDPACAVYVVTVAWQTHDLKQDKPSDSSTLCADTRHNITDAYCIVAEIGP